MAEVLEHPEMRSQLYSALADIDRPLLLERSVKSIGPELRSGRFLISFPRAALGPGPSRKFSEICRSLNAPADGFCDIDDLQVKADVVHFGYEPEAGVELLKTYLEFKTPLKEQPKMRFFALKWRQDGVWVHSKYTSCEDLGLDARKAILETHITAGPQCDVMVGLSEQVGPHASFLEVTEPGNPRVSVDLNLTAAPKRVGEMVDALQVFLGKQATAYMQEHRDDTVGHVSAGVARDGRAFSAVYHGAKFVHGELA